MVGGRWRKAPLARTRERRRPERPSQPDTAAEPTEIEGGEPKEAKKGKKASRAVCRVRRRARIAPGMELAGESRTADAGIAREDRRGRTPPVATPTIPGRSAPSHSHHDAAVRAGPRHSTVSNTSWMHIHGTSGPTQPAWNHVTLTTIKFTPYVFQ